MIMVKGAEETSSYEEEVEAMKKALELINLNAGEGVSILIVTDSQSLCVSLSGPSTSLDEIHLLLDNCKHQLTIQWVPGHAGIEGNELADRHAKQATSLPEPPRSVTLGSAKSVINRTIGEKLPIRDDIAEAYSGFSRASEVQIQERDDQRLLAQLRSGQHKAFGDYHKRLNKEHDPTCHRCHLTADSVKHWLTECPATMETRAKLFQTRDNGLRVLSTHPMECVTLAKKFGVLSC